MRSKETDSKFCITRWQFGLESSHILEVRIRATEQIDTCLETYYVKMRKDGRFGIPKLIMKL